MVNSILKLFALPELASEHGELVDHMNAFVHWFMAILFIGWSIYLCRVFWRYNAKRNPKASYRGMTGHSTTHVEIGVVIVEAILLLGFAFPLWSRQADEYPREGKVIKLRAVGEQFKWTFHYAGNDDMLGAIDPRLTTQTNSIGQDKSDPNGKDDFLVGGKMTLCVGRPVIIDVRSKDVIHNLSIVPMRASQDATPGVKSHMWFTPTKVGEWDIICAQLCGSGHANMKATIEVLSEKDFDTWLKGNSDDALKASAPAAPAAK
jgi:cytochrome c oxidase subunit II